jgi:hypothetical protein
MATNTWQQSKYSTADIGRQYLKNWHLMLGSEIYEESIILQCE